MQNRRDFLKTLAVGGAAYAVSGCTSQKSWIFGGVSGSPMHRYAAPAIKHVRVGIIHKSPSSRQ